MINIYFFFFFCRVELSSFYFLIFYQFKIELEDGFIENDKLVDFRYSESEFFGFFWFGYVVFLQFQVICNFYFYFNIILKFSFEFKSCVVDFVQFNFLNDIGEVFFY